jgi:YHS domain-containing protein
MSRLPHLRRLNPSASWWLGVAFAGVIGFLAATPARAGEPPVNTLKNSIFGGRTDTAINGYDTVAYFTDNKPVKGLDAYVQTWMGAKWKFASQAHLDLFKAKPEQYAPQFGGY